MIKQFLVVGGLAAGLLTVPLAPQPAEAIPMAKFEVAKAGGVTLARRGGGFRGKGGFGRRGFGRPKIRSFRGFRGPRVHRFRHRRVGPRHFRRRFYAPFAYYGVYPRYYNSGPCGWLRRRALRTGSRYWWRRYHRCLSYYY